MFEVTKLLKNSKRKFPRTYLAIANKAHQVVRVFLMLSDPRNPIIFYIYKVRPSTT